MTNKRRIISVETKPELMLGIFDYLDTQDIAFTSMSSAVTSFIEHHLQLYRTAGTLPSYEDKEDCEVLVSNRVMLVGKVKKLRQPLDGVGAKPAPGNKTRGFESLQAVLQGEGRQSSAVTDTDFSPLSLDLNIQSNLTGFPNLPDLSEVDEILGKSLTTEELYPSTQKAQQREIFGFDDLDQIMQLAAAEHELEQEIDLLSKITIGTVDSNKPRLQETKRQNAVAIDDPRLDKDRIWKSFASEGDEAKMFALRIIYYHLPQEHWSSPKAEELLLSMLSQLS